jgi:hypothetical protein
LLLANGTVLLLCDSTAIYAGSSVLGPWARVGTLTPTGGLAATYEDATLFVDARGHFHALFHAYNVDKTDSCVGSIVSAHAYSRDGLQWTGSPEMPFGNEVEFDDGSSLLVATRERPQLVFDAAGTPTHLVTAVTGGTDWCWPDGNTPCVNCKYQFWDFSLVQPLDLSA